MANGHHAKTLPAELNAPAFVAGWRMKALAVGAAFSVIAIILGFLSGDGWNHFLRAWLVGLMLCFGFAVGGMALLMVQYLSGGKWGLLVRRPLEAMSRTLPVAFVYFLPIGFFMKKLYLWAQYPDGKAAYSQHLINAEQAHAIIFKKGILNPTTFWATSIVCFLIWAGFGFLLNSWSLKRDADTEPNVPYWQKKFENISGIGVVTYSILLTACAILWVMSLDPTWYSTVYGLQFLVGQGYAVLALVILTLIGLSNAEPIRTIFRVTEQHDLGKLCFAFTMLNMYLAFASFLIIWSGNSPEEIPWYLDRIRGGWGVIATLDVIFHWLIPFSLLLSRDLKRIKGRLVVVCCIMLFARLWDTFWLVEPNFADARRNLHFSVGILEYIAVPAAMIAFWMAYYFTQLTTRPLVATNDPHVAEILEPEHAHA
ncbi:hypothetical protein [Silvibacterium acidisoli]|uniref:hypothetical protein n=1 Tax=Acidobacteriaceae bacterium ZG23-2 TaxID=2883246 RepID=UPI00406D07F1